MTTMVTVTPGSPSRTTITVTGRRTYTCAYGSTIQVPDFDAAELLANGWSGATMPQQTAATANVQQGGSGGNTLTLTADTDIAAGSSVSVNSAGHVQQTWGPAPIIASTQQIGDAESYWGLLRLSADAFVVFSNGSSIGAIPGTISGGTIALGTFLDDADIGTMLKNITPINAPQINAGGVIVGMAAALSTTSFVIAYPDISTTHMRVKAFTISSGVITAGTSVEVDTNTTTSDGTNYFTGIVGLDGTHFALTFNSSVGSEAVVGSVSGTSITLGTPVTWGSTSPPAIQALSSSKVIICYSDSANSQFVTAVVGSISGTTLTLGTPVALASLPTNGANVVAQPIALSASLAVISWQSGLDSSNPLYAAAISISGSVPTIGTPFQISYLQNSDFFVAAALSATSFAMATQDSSLGVFVGNVSGTTISGQVVDTPTPPVLLNGFVSSYANANGILSLAAVSATDFIFADLYSNIFEGSSSGISSFVSHPQTQQYVVSPVDGSTVLAAFIDPAGILTVRLVGSNPISVAPPIGFAASAITSGNSGTITTSGVASGFTGLAPGAAYYHDGDGSIVTANTGHKAGVALTTSTLLMAA
jgi:hypothetical protein